MERRFRLRTNADFQRVRREGQSWSNRWLVLVRAPNQGPVSRFGFAIGKRVGGAVVRNRLKRQLREAIRLYLRQEHVAPGFDVIIIARQPAMGAPFATLVAALNELLSRAGLIQKRDEPEGTDQESERRGQESGDTDQAKREAQIPGPRQAAPGCRPAARNQERQELGP
ncbi:MAG TPA: ribonuclease P protein component [Chloroflexi bacterium]|nr:ribonuclease P protein component [Chloroflexota bacterium]